VSTLLVAFSLVASLQAYPVGDEFGINTNVDNPATIADDDQIRPDVAMDTNGNFVVVFQSDVPDNITDVAARLYDAAGVPLGNQFQVNTTGPNDTMFPVVAMDADGDFVVVWQDNFADSNSDGIMAQRYNAAGVAQGANVTVNTTTLGQQYKADVAMDADGDFVVVWEDNPFSNFKRRVRGQRFSADGTQQGAELEISTDTDIDHTWPQVAMDADGDFAVSWQSGDVGANQDVAVRRFDATGNPVGAPVLINGTTRVDNESQVNPNTSVAMDENGNFVVVWKADNFTGPGIPGSAIGIVARRFDASGSAQGPQFLVDAIQPPRLGTPDVAMNADGDFIIAYRRDDGSLSGSWAQRYYADGSPKGAPLRVNTFTLFNQKLPAIAIDANANAAVVWESNGNAEQDGAGSGIFGQRLSGLGIQPAMDFNNDFHADIPWRNTGNGANAIWLMNGFTLQAVKSIGGLYDLMWKMVGVGDFDRDGNADLVWRHDQTGSNVIWFMEGFTLKSFAATTSVTSANWRIAGTGDFNRDGKSDLLWRSDLTGAVVIWLMDGSSLISGGSLGVPGPRWHIAGVNDFNADGKSDILLRHTTGLNTIWLVDGLAIKSGQLIAQVSDVNWEVAGTGDFNMDGKADILWRHALTGNNLIWLMDVFSIDSWQLIQGLPDTNWSVEGVRDFNRDVKADILWRHGLTGHNAIWLMDGFTITAGRTIAGVPDTNWSIVP